MVFIYCDLLFYIILKEQWGGAAAVAPASSSFSFEIFPYPPPPLNPSPLSGGPQEGTQPVNSAQPGMGYRAAGLRPVSLLLLAERAFHDSWTHHGPSPYDGNSVSAGAGPLKPRTNKHVPKPADSGIFPVPSPCVLVGASLPCPEVRPWGTPQVPSSTPQWEEHPCGEEPAVHPGDQSL